MLFFCGGGGGGIGGGVLQHTKALQADKTVLSIVRLGWDSESCAKLWFATHHQDGLLCM